MRRPRKLESLYFSVALILLMSCGGSSSSPFLSYDVVHRAQYLGEFMQKDGANHLVSVSRDTPTEKGLGLVRLKLDDLSIEVLDESAVEAKDILVSEKDIAFRDRDLISWIANQEKKELSSFSATKLSGFSSEENFWIFSFKDSADQNHALCFSKIDDSFNSIALDTEVIKQEGFNLWVQSNEGVQLLKLNSCENLSVESVQTILPKIETQYIQFYSWNGKKQMAYLDESDGCLKHIVFNETYGIESQSLVDGRPDDSYVGMDIQFFEWESQLGLLYLDGWELAPKIALFDGSKWRTQSLPAYGASGFYNQVMQVEGNELIAAWHSFRTAFSNDDVSFEDLVLARIRLDF